MSAVGTKTPLEARSPFYIAMNWKTYEGLTPAEKKIIDETTGSLDWRCCCGSGRSGRAGCRQAAWPGRYVWYFM